MTYEKSPCSLGNTSTKIHGGSFPRQSCCFLFRNSWGLKIQTSMFHSCQIHPFSWKNPSKTNVASVPYHLFFCVVLHVSFSCQPKKTSHPKHFTRSRHDGCIFSSPVSQEIRRSLPSTNLSRAPWFESFPSSRHLNRTAFPSWTWSRLQIVSLSCLKIAGGVALHHGNQGKPMVNSPLKRAGYFLGGLALEGPLRFRWL